MKTYTVNIINSKLNLDVFEFGNGEGETCLITAGIHGAEDTSILTAFEVIKCLKSTNVKGSVIVVPVCNPTGFYNFSKQVVPEDGLNLNRIFPGMREGTLSQRIAYTLEHQLVNRCDYHVDLHGGDVHEQVMPFAYYVGVAHEDVVLKSKKMAQSLKMNAIVKSSSSTGAYNHSGTLGKPSILIERGGAFEKRSEIVNLYKEDVLSVLVELKFISELNLGLGGFNQDHKGLNLDVTVSKYPIALYSGFWKPRKTPGDLIQKGEILGIIQDINAQVLQTIVAEAEGIILYQVHTLGICKGSETVAYGVL